MLGWKRAFLNLESFNSQMAHNNNNMFERTLSPKRREGVLIWAYMKVFRVHVLKFMKFTYQYECILPLFQFILKSYDNLLRNPPKYRALSLDEGPFREDFDIY